MTTDPCWMAKLRRRYTGIGAASIKRETEGVTTESEAHARKELFSTIVPIYDQVEAALCNAIKWIRHQVNDAMSLGQHWEWKRRCVLYSGARLGSQVLDVCCGSGDLAFLLAQKVGRQGQVSKDKRERIF